MLGKIVLGDVLHVLHVLHVLDVLDVLDVREAISSAKQYNEKTKLK